MEGWETEVGRPTIRDSGQVSDVRKKQQETIEPEKIWAQNYRKRKISTDIQKAKEKQLENFQTLIKNSR